MNEITRIHIAKTAYDIEIAAKKQLEKYIKSLETYTQDKEVLADIEIRITELLAERGVAAGGVISTDDVAAIRAQLGEPYEFADGDGDISVGPDAPTSRRLYRSTDNAVLGGVLSGVAAYFNINPLWTRLVFVLLLFISFGTAALVYILFWIFTPAARTATEKLQLAGKDVTLESIKQLNNDEEKAQPSRVAPVLQNVLSISLGSISALTAISLLIGIVWMVIAALTLNTSFMDITNNFAGLGDGNMWLVWLLFWITIFGLLLLTALFSLIAYAFFAKKLNKTMIISGVVIVVLGIASVATVVGVSATQSMRIANETRSMMQETRANLPKQFADVTSVTFETDMKKVSDGDTYLSLNNAAIRYIVDEGTPRYELHALTTSKAIINVDGTNATIALDIPENFRNSFVQPMITVYGPALQSIKSSANNLNYEGQAQDSLKVINDHVSISIGGSYGKVEVSGSGVVDLGTATVQALDVKSDQNLTVSAGTVRELTVTQPDVCPVGSYRSSASVVVSGVTSGQMTYNGVTMPAKSHQTSCAEIVIQGNEEYDV